MNIEWKKAEGEHPILQPYGEVLAVNQDGDVNVGFLYMGKNGSWRCDSEDNLLRNVSWYIFMDELLATVPKENPK